MVNAANAAPSAYCVAVVVGATDFEKRFLVHIGFASVSILHY